METYVDGQGKDHWCGSNLPVPEVQTIINNEGIDYCKNVGCYMGGCCAPTFEYARPEVCLGNGTRPAHIAMYIVCM
jgi:hypothetical protein